MMTAKQYVELIDNKYYEAKRARISRFSVEWGKWSRDTNLDIRKRIESKKDPEDVLIKQVIIYWTIRSQLLELFHKSKVGSLGKKRKLGKEAGFIKKIILTGDCLSDINLENIADSILSGVLK